MKEIHRTELCCDSAHCINNEICSLHTSYELEMEESGSFRDFEPTINNVRDGYIVAAYCNDFVLYGGN